MQHPLFKVFKEAFMMYDFIVLILLERTEKLPMSSIRNVISEPIEGHEEYHILVRLL